MAECVSLDTARYRVQRYEDFWNYRTLNKKSCGKIRKWAQWGLAPLCLFNRKRRIQRNLTFLQPYNLTEGYIFTVLRGGSEYGVVML